jgi:hypothetical protein
MKDMPTKTRYYMDATIELKVGETEGEFALAYYLSKNNSGLQAFARFCPVGESYDYRDRNLQR